MYFFATAFIGFQLAFSNNLRCDKNQLVSQNVEIKMLLKLTTGSKQGKFFFFKILLRLLIILFYRI